MTQLRHDFEPSLFGTSKVIGLFLAQARTRTSLVMLIVARALAVLSILLTLRQSRFGVCGICLLASKPRGY